MPRPGQNKKRTSASSDAKERLLEAGEETLRTKGFFDASARAIAEQAGVAVGGIHYHFDSVEDLLLQVVDRTNDERLEEYRQLASSTNDLGALVRDAAHFFEADREAGRFRILAEMMAGATGGGDFATAVSDRTEPWVDLTDSVVRRFVGDEPLGVLRSRDVAVAVVALFVGLELLDDIDGERFDTAGVLTRGAALAALAAAMFGGASDAA